MKVGASNSSSIAMSKGVFEFNLSISASTCLKRIAFFGATGGCTDACLARTLAAGYRSIVLARTPVKLLEQLQRRGLQPDTVKKTLTVAQGDVKDLAAVKKALVIDGQVVDVIMCGIGNATNHSMDPLSTLLIISFKVDNQSSRCASCDLVP